MIWAARTFSRNGWYTVQDQFEEQYDQAGEPADMMLVAVETPDFRTRIIMGVSDPSLLGAYDGFAPLAESELPRFGHLLFGHQQAFEARFRWRKLT
jgi:hypothetical protein